MPLTDVTQMPFSKLYPMLVNKAVKKGRTREEVDQVTAWLTGYTSEEIARLEQSDICYGDFFRGAPTMNPNRTRITGKVCGIRVEMIDDPLMREIRYLAKLVEELAARKAEIAERRRLQEEANKANKGKKRKKQVKAPQKPVNKAGRIGIRTYALGRDYDPDRYGGVTPYRDPQEIIDEQAVEEAYKKKRRRKAEAVEQAMEQAVEAGDLEAVKALEVEQAALAEAEEAAAEAEREAGAGTAGADAPEESVPAEEDAPLSEQVFEDIFEETDQAGAEDEDEDSSGPSKDA